MPPSGSIRCLFLGVSTYAPILGFIAVLKHLTYSSWQKMCNTHRTSLAECDADCLKLPHVVQLKDYAIHRLNAATHKAP